MFVDVERNFFEKVDKKTQGALKQIFFQVSTFRFRILI